MSSIDTIMHLEDTRNLTPLVESSGQDFMPFSDYVWVVHEVSAYYGPAEDTPELLHFFE